MYEKIEPGHPWYSLFVTEFFMNVYNLPFNVENQIRALVNLQKTYELDVVFPQMNLDEFGTLFEPEKLKQGKKPQNREEWSALAATDVVDLPPSDQILISPSYRVIKKVKGHPDPKIEFKHIGAFVPAPYSLFTSIAGIQVASELCLLKRKFVRSVMDQAVNAIVEYCKKLTGMVDTFLILAPSECTISRRSYMTTVDASMNDLIQRLSKELKVPTAIHFCTPNNEHLVNEQVVKPMKEAGLQALNIPNILENLNLARDLDLALWGGIDPITVQREPREIVLPRIEKLVQETKDIRFILGTNCQVHQIPKVICSGALLDKLMVIKKLLPARH